ncbi:MAG: CapA family protein [Desulfomicrobium escambiense]|nr:CapA family protein [Desulfomicrobium escambiense]
MRSALDYVELAEHTTGPLPRKVPLAYVWGDALDELARARPDARIINLETAVTTADEAWPGKGIHYRMHPANVGVPHGGRASIAACWPTTTCSTGAAAGSAKRCDTLRAAGVAYRRRRARLAPEAAAAGGHSASAEQARRAGLCLRHASSCGTPRDWAATDTRAGVALLPDLSSSAVRGRSPRACRRSGSPGDVGRRLDPLGRQLGLCGAARRIAPSPTALIDHRARSTWCTATRRTTPMGIEVHREPPDPVWLRRLHQRLRRHRWPGKLPCRAGPDVFPDRGRQGRQAAAPDDDANLCPSFPRQPGVAGRCGLDRRHARPRKPRARNAGGEDERRRTADRALR